MLSSHPDIAAEAMAEDGAEIADNEEDSGEECGGGERGGREEGVEGRRGKGDGDGGRVGGREEGGEGEEKGEGEGEEKGDVFDPTHLSVHPEDILVSLRSCEGLAAAVMGYLDRAHIVGQAHLVCR